jgi:hypothetical protein
MRHKQPQPPLTFLGLELKISLQTTFIVMKGDLSGHLAPIAERGAGCWENQALVDILGELEEPLHSVIREHLSDLNLI